MRKYLAGITAVTVLLAAGAAAGQGFRLESGQIAEGVEIPKEYTMNAFGCSGGNVSPELRWSGAPEGTRSFAVTVYDPDAPTGSGWWHWVVFNLPATATGLPAGAGGGKDLPEGAVQSRTDYGAPGYGGPCPPEGDKPHRYEFTVHALKVDALPLDADASGAMVGYYLNANKLATASVTAVYGR